MKTPIWAGAVALGLLFSGAAAAAAPHVPCASPVLPADQRIKQCLAATAKKDAAPADRAADWLDLAQAYDAWGDRRRELDALNRAVAAKPDFWEARIKRAQLLMQSLAFEQAAPDVLALRKAFPGPAPVVKPGLPPQNLTPAQRSAFMVPSLSRELVMRAARRCRAQAIVGLDLDGARKDCQMAMQIDSGKQSTQTYEPLGIVEFREGNWKAAKSAFEAELKLDPHAISSLYLKGIAEKRMGDNARGDADIAQAEKTNPNLAQQGREAGLMP